MSQVLRFALLGAGAGLGLLLVLRGLPRPWWWPRVLGGPTPGPLLRRVRMHAAGRTAGGRSPGGRSPAGRSTLGGSPGTGSPQVGLIAGLAAPWLERLLVLADRADSGQALPERLKRAGLASDGAAVTAFRVSQARWAVLGALGVAGFGVLRWLGGQAPSLSLPALALSAACAGWLLRDKWLSAAATKRQERFLAEFPAAAELLAMAVAAGESPVAALERTARACGGVVGQELTATVNDIQAGSPTTAALELFRERIPAPVVGRFTDAIIVAWERGTPLGDVLRAQAADVRAERRRQLMEMAGKKEIAMLVPVVFLCLPVTVVFALYPGLVGLSFGS